MAYKYFRFGASQILPGLNISQEIGTGEARIDAIDAPRGGAFDSLGRETASRGGYSLRVSGTITPPIGGGPAELTRYYDALRACLGRRDKLWRRGGDGSFHWAWARLVSIEAVREATFQNKQEMSLVFYIFSALWQGTLHGSWRLDDGNALNDGLTLDTDLIYPLAETVTPIPIVNNGNALVRDFEIAVTAQSSPITRVRIEKPGETSLVWNGNLQVGNSLVVDFGAMSITNSGVDAYAGLTLTSEHKIDDWMRLDPGVNIVTLTRAGGGPGCSATVVNYDGWI